MAINAESGVRFYRDLVHDLLGLFLPDLCLFCMAPLRESELYACARCWAGLPVFPDRTGAPLRSLRGLLDRLWIGWAYDERVRRIVHLFKYDGRPELAETLVREWLRAIPHAEELGEAEVLLPVPIHAARMRWRGFNQSERLAKQLGKSLGLPVAGQEAIRIVNTPSQTLLDREERWRSVAQAFQILQPKRFQGRRVLILDDLATSGATLHALARLLKGCEASAVWAAVLTSPVAVDSQS